MNTLRPAFARLAPRLGLASFRRRIIVRSAFLLLILITLALAVVLLQEEKARSFSTRQLGFEKTRAEILARLRHPSGHLALLNPTSGRTPKASLRPLLLPFSAIDFDDRLKAHQAVELAGCLVHFADGGSVCVAIGANPFAGGFVYVIGSFFAGELKPRPRGMLTLDGIHRAQVTLRMRGITTRWVAPYEVVGAMSFPQRGRLTGFLDTGATLLPTATPVRDFRGWLWQARACATPDADILTCKRRTYFSVRLPVDALIDELYRTPNPVWPPPDLDRIEVALAMLGPGGAVLFDSDAPHATAPLTLDDLALQLQSGETLTVRDARGRELAVRTGAAHDGEALPPWLLGLIRRLPVRGSQVQLEAHDVIATSTGNFDVRLSGDLRSVERNLGLVVARLRWFVAAMLGAIALAWLVVEIGLIRPIALLTRRAAAVSYNVQDERIAQRIGELEVADLRGSDEIGILAGSLADLLRRVKGDVEREHIRVAQEHDLWHAVGHEIMSPLQSLMVLYGKPEDPGYRYVQRMQQAVRVFYGSASPREALAAAPASPGVLDFDAFLHHIAANAHFAGIADVRYSPTAAPVWIRADEYLLEDVVTHILSNADRHRLPATPITLALEATDTQGVATVHNLGPLIDPALLGRIFEYGVSACDVEGMPAHRGQGLFVAKTYMAKMGGTVSAHNVEDGVVFTLTLQRSGV